MLTEPDERFWLGVDASRDDRWIMFGAGSKITSEFRLLSTDDPEGEPRIVAPRRQGVEYDVEPAGDRLLIVHNDGAEDFELAEAPLDATQPHRVDAGDAAPVRASGSSASARTPATPSSRCAATGSPVCTCCRGLPPATCEPGRDIAFDEPLYVVDAPGESDYETSTIRVGYGSMLTPDSVYDYDLTTAELTLLKRSPVLDDPRFGPYRPENYVQERGWATAPDGTRVPLSIVRRGRRRTGRLGAGPALRLRLVRDLDRPELRHPAALAAGPRHRLRHRPRPRRWRAGPRLVRAGQDADQEEHLHRLRRLRGLPARARLHLADRLAARGGSAGGLLMGAVANLAPEKFRAIHAAVPFVDALTTILDPDLPLTVIEWEEWGDPLHDAEVYAYMKSYTPYENVRPMDYPAILATTSLNDTRVFYVEPAKWIAALRHVATNTGERQILLKTEMVAGHGGVSGRYKSWRELAFEYAWIVSEITGED